MKSFGRGLCSTLLKITLFSAAITAALVAVIGTPGTIKKSIGDSKLYNSVVDTVFTEAQSNLEADSQQAVASAAPDLKQAAATSFTPEVLKNSSETIIDSIYKWLGQDGGQPDFHVDLSAQKAQFIAAVGASAEQHFNTLPACTSEQLQAIEPDADAFSLTCRPPGLTAAAAREKVVSDLNNSDFLKDPVLSADTLTKNNSGQNPFENAKSAQQGFKLFKLLPWVLLGVSALLAVGVFFLSTTRRKGFKSLGITLLGTGVFLLIGSWLASFILDKMFSPGGAIYKNATTELQKALVATLKSLNSQFGRTLLIYCLVYIVLGAGTLLALHFTKPKELERVPEVDKPNLEPTPNKVASETKEKSAV